MPLAALLELQQLSTWGAWVTARRSWLRDRLAAGDLPAEGWSALGGTTPVRLPGAPETGRYAPTPAPAPHRAPSAGSLLLAGGAVLLVLAGIAFVAFAWDLLGPAGQVLTLFALGALTMAAGVRLRVRLPGTATTLGIVGALLVAVSTVATRTLGVDVVGETGALVGGVLASVLLAGAGVAIRSRLPAVGEVAALVGGSLTLGLLALAPADQALPLGDAWGWWAAVVLMVGGVGLLLLADEFAVRTWPALAGASLLLGGLVLAGHVSDQGNLTDASRAFVFVLTLLAASAVDVVLARRLPGRHPAPAWSAAGLAAVATVVAWVTGVAVPGSRLRSAVVLALVVVLALWTRRMLPAKLRVPADIVLTLLCGATVGMAAAPWSDGWASWNGPVGGLALGALLVAVAETDPRQERDTPAQGAAALVAAASGLATWLVAVSSVEPVPDATLRGVAAALVVVGVAAWAEALRRRLPAWSVWLPGVAVGVAASLLLETSTLEVVVEPEVYAFVLAGVAAIAGGLTWYLRRPLATTSLVTVGPALTLALAPTTLVVAGDTLDRWWFGDDPGTAYQVRVAALFAVGAAGVVVGAWRHLAGVVAPSAGALLVVVAVQLVELGRFLPQWVSFAVAGIVLVAAGARWESVRTLGREGRTWARHLT
jgi:hypothetical protein